MSRGCEYVQIITRAERSVATDAFSPRRLGAAFRERRLGTGKIIKKGLAISDMVWYND